MVNFKNNFFIDFNENKQITEDYKVEKEIQKKFQKDYDEHKCLNRELNKELNIQKKN